MGAGNDSITTPSTRAAYCFSGGYGNDYLLGNSGKDVAYGEWDSDTLSGGSDNDTLCRTQRLQQSLWRDRDVEHLSCGTQTDLLVGGYDTSTATTTSTARS